MNFTTLITDLSQLINLDSTDTTNLANMKRWINNIYKDLQTRYRWSWLVTEGNVQTVLTYDTGTVTVTNASRTVTGSGVTWTSSMIGRYFNVRENTDWYKIINVSGSTITLDKPYLRDTGSGKTYYIWNKTYRLNTDAQELLDVYCDNNRKSLKCLSIRDFGAMYHEYYQGEPSAYIETEVDKVVRNYTTGTVSGSADSRTLTGSGTAFLDNVSPGDEIVISTYTYNVQTVDSDTQLTLVGALQAQASTASYTARRSEVKTIQFDYTPITYAKNVTYKYIKKIYDMQNNNDLPDMPERWTHVIILGAQYLAYKAIDDSREAQALQIYEGKIKQMIREDTSKGNQPQTWTRFTCGY